MKPLLQKLARGERLSEDEAAAAMERVMDGEATPAQVGGLLMALAVRGECEDEVVGFARAMRARALPFEAPGAVDTCGTGGDGASTLNISTLASFVVAGCGVPVAKHGNRSASGSVGSADVLEALGLDIGFRRRGEPVAGPAGAHAADGRGSAPAPLGGGAGDSDVIERARRSFDAAGWAFLFAPAFHASTRSAAGPRRELGVRTAFNLLGPLTNPARPVAQLVGVPRVDLAPFVARCLARLGTPRAWVVCGGGLDELAPDSDTAVAVLAGGHVSVLRVAPEDAGLARSPRAALAVRDVEHAADVARAVLAGERGPARDAVVLNAAAALVVADRAHDLREGAAFAAEALDAGRAARVVEVARAACAERQP
ncbi:MAG: anthranilate phosphoribosyltransferase [Vicinamibacteria bacterium]|nr:anthranilate phosphoribosyltransferase [Vicinamibacteria bacterium]